MANRSATKPGSLLPRRNAELDPGFIARETATKAANMGLEKIMIFFFFLIWETGFSGW